MGVHAVLSNQVLLDGLDGGSAAAVSPLHRLEHLFCEVRLLGGVILYWWHLWKKRKKKKDAAMLPKEQSLVVFTIFPISAPPSSLRIFASLLPTNFKPPPPAQA